MKREEEGGGKITCLSKTSKASGSSKRPSLGSSPYSKLPNLATMGETYPMVLKRVFVDDTG
jgi:hypothetical protein